MLSKIKEMIFNLLFFKNDYSIGSGAWILYNFDKKSWEYISDRVPVKYILHKRYNYINFWRQLPNRKNLTWKFITIDEKVNEKNKLEVIVQGYIKQDDELVASMECVFIQANTIYKK